MCIWKMKTTLRNSLKAFDAFCFIALSSFFLLSAMCFADSEARPYPYITASEFGTCYFKMLPEQTDQFPDREKGHGFCYKAGFGRQDLVLWETDGWYSFEVYLSDDCKYLARMGDWARGSIPSNKHLAVAFYKEGILLQSYSTKDLIRNPLAVQKSVSHYQWEAEPAKFDHWQNRLEIVTIEGKKYVFDITTGNVVSTNLFKKYEGKYTK